MQPPEGGCLVYRPQGRWESFCDAQTLPYIAYPGCAQTIPSPPFRNPPKPLNLSGLYPLRYNHTMLIRRWIVLVLLFCLLPAVAAQTTPPETLQIGFYGAPESRAARAMQMALTQIEAEGAFTGADGRAYRFEGVYSDDPAALTEALAVLAMPDAPPAEGITWEMPVFLLDSDAPLILPGIEAEVYRGQSSAEHRRAMLVRFMTAAGGVQRAYVIGDDPTAQAFAAEFLAQDLVQVRQRPDGILTAEAFDALMTFNPQAIIYRGDVTSAQGLLDTLGGRGWSGYVWYEDALTNIPPRMSVLRAEAWSPLAEDALSAGFVADYRAFVGSAPDARAVAAYDLTWALRLLVTRAGATPLELRLTVPVTAPINTVQGTFNPAAYGVGEVYRTAHILDQTDTVLARYDGGVLQDIAPQVAALPTPTPIPSPTPARPTFTVTTGTLNVRQGPDRAYAVVGQLDNGQTVGALAQLQSGAWYLIESPFGLGWVQANLGTLYTPSEDALQVIDPPPPPTATPIPTRAPIPTPMGGAAPPPIQQPQQAPAAAPNPNFALGGHVRSQEAAGTLEFIGMQWLKQQVRWERGETPANGAGPAIQGARERGMRILIGSVGWPDEMGGDFDAYFEEYTAYLAQVAALGPDAIEVWNEPNLSREWPVGRVDGTTYTDLLRRAYTAIKAANPDVMVISGAPAPTGFFSRGCTAEGCDDDVFLRQMANAGAAQYMDCLGAHFNEGAISPGRTSGDPRGTHHSYYLIDLIALYDSIFGGEVPLCFTEFGYLTAEGLPPLPPGFGWAGETTLQQHAAWLAEAVQVGRTSGRVRMMIVWNIDFTSYDSDPRAGYAILRPDGTCPACQTLQNALR